MGWPTDTTNLNERPSVPGDGRPFPISSIHAERIRRSCHVIRRDGESVAEPDVAGAGGAGIAVEPVNDRVAGRATTCVGIGGHYEDVIHPVAGVDSDSNSLVVLRPTWTATHLQPRGEESVDGVAVTGWNCTGSSAGATRVAAEVGAGNRITLQHAGVNRVKGSALEP